MPSKQTELGVQVAEENAAVGLPSASKFANVTVGDAVVRLVVELPRPRVALDVAVAADAVVDATALVKWLPGTASLGAGFGTTTAVTTVATMKKKSSIFEDRVS